MSATRSGRRGVLPLIAVTTVGLAAASLSLAPATAATPSVPRLEWNVSQQFVDHLSTRTIGGGATFDPGSTSASTDDHFTFAGAGSTNAGGLVTHAYSGSVKGAFAMGGTEYYSVTIADPAVSVESDGDGRLTAVVSAANAAAMGNPAESTQPKRVTVAEFSGATSMPVNVTPNWSGVLPANSARAVELGLASDKPVDGKSFHPDFLAAITKGVRAHFHASGASSDTKKSPGVITARGPVTTASVTSSSAAGGVNVRVTGTGFNPSVNAGDAGVYVGVAPADAVIDYSNRDSMAAFAQVDWVTPQRFSEDSFTTVLNVAAGKLDSTKTYAVYTWQAHTRSNATQDTKTPITIDWSTLTPPNVTPTPTPTPTATPTVTSTPTVPTPPKADARIRAKITKPGTSAAKLVVRVTGAEKAATGKLAIKIKVPGKKATTRTAALVDGKASAKLPAAVRYKVVVTYAGDDSYNPERTVVKHRAKRHQ